MTPHIPRGYYRPTYFILVLLGIVLLAYIITWDTSTRQTLKGVIVGSVLDKVGSGQEGDYTDEEGEEAAMRDWEFRRSLMYEGESCGVAGGGF
jgi:hypothetical protein